MNTGFQFSTRISLQVPKPLSSFNQLELKSNFHQKLGRVSNSADQHEQLEFHRLSSKDGRKSCDFMVTAIRKIKGDEGVRSPRGGTTETIKPRPTDVPKWVEFPSEPDQHTFSEETNCRSKQVGVNKESSWAALTNDKNKKGGSCMKRKKQFFNCPQFLS